MCARNHILCQGQRKDFYTMPAGLIKKVHRMWEKVGKKRGATVRWISVCKPGTGVAPLVFLISRKKTPPAHLQYAKDSFFEDF